MYRILWFPPAPKCLRAVFRICTRDPHRRVNGQQKARGPRRGTRTHQVLLIGVVRVQQVDEATHEALLLGKILGVLVVGGLVRLVLDQRGHQVQDGVHLSGGRAGEDVKPASLCERNRRSKKINKKWPTNARLTCSCATMVVLKSSVLPST